MINKAIKQRQSSIFYTLQLFYQCNYVVIAVLFFIEFHFKAVDLDIEPVIHAIFFPRVILYTFLLFLLISGSLGFRGWGVTLGFGGWGFQLMGFGKGVFNYFDPSLVRVEKLETSDFN